MPIDEDNIFSANLTENNEIEEFLVKKDQKYMVTGFSINLKIDTDLIIPNLIVRKSLSDTIRSYKQEREKFDLDCHFFKKIFTWYNYLF